MLLGTKIYKYLQGSVFDWKTTGKNEKGSKGPNERDFKNLNLMATNVYLCIYFNMKYAIDVLILTFKTMDR